jgi:hypothetical protein
VQDKGAVDVKHNWIEFDGYDKTPSFYQDRLGTNIGKTQKKSGVLRRNVPHCTLPYAGSRYTLIYFSDTQYEVHLGAFVAPFYTKNDHFTKTGSGQTQGNLKKEYRFLGAGGLASRR